MNASTPAFGELRASLLQRIVLSLVRIPPLYRGSLRPLWVKLLNALRSGPVDVESVFGRFRVYPTTNLVDSALLIHPCYNQEEIDFLKAGTAAGGTFVDVGANIGLYSVALGNFLKPGGRVVSIEPNPVCVGRLRHNLALNGLDPAGVFDVGVGDFDGKAKLVILRNDLAIAHIVRDDVGGDFAVRQLLSILDDAGLQTIDALKIDVEGFERAALEPFFRAAPRSRWPKRICMEHLHDSDVMAGILRGCGYRLVKNTRNNALLILE
jgi:FkbM family methyltransferase